MSMNVAELIREIEAFMRGKDLSSSPQFRRMYTAYCEYCRSAAEELDTCRHLVEQGNLAEARRCNLAADPPFSSRVKMLQFERKKEFIELALSYGFPAPVEADMALVAKLESPVSSQEKNLQQLMRRWRQTARAGKTAEKIALLREIIPLIPPEGALEWKKNLASFERLRDAEIAEFLAGKTWTLDDLAQLESCNLELNFPKRLTIAPENTRSRIRELLTPLQKKHVATLIEAKLDVLQALYAERNLAALNQQFSEFSAIVSHPLAELTSAQQQIRQDIAGFLQMENRRRQTQERFDRLVKDLETAFGEGKTYEEIECIYNELRLLDLPLSDALIERCEVLRSEHEAMERRRVIRRGVYAVGTVVLILIALGVSIHYAMYFRNVRQACESFDKLLNADDFDTVFVKYQELQKNSPRIARDPEVAARINRAHSMRDNLKKMQSRANAEFLRARARIDALQKGDFLDSKEIDDTIAEVEKMRPYLSRENLDEWGKQKGDIARRREELKTARKKDFLRHHQERLARLRQIKAELPAAPDVALPDAEIRSLRQAYQAEFDRLHPSVRDEVGKACDGEWKQLNADVDFALARERETRDFYRQLDHPKDLTEHLRAMRDVALKRPDIARKYQKLSERDIGCFEQLDAGIRFLESSELKAILSGSVKIPDDGKNSLIGEDVSFVASDPSAPAVEAAFGELMKNLDYYEVSLKTSSGPEIVLYAKDKPIIQRINRESVRGVRIQAMLAVNAAKPVPVNLRIKGNNRYSLECNEKLAPTLNSIAPIIEIAGIDLERDECAKNVTYLLLREIKSQSGMSREGKLRAFIEKECAIKEKNPLIQLVALQKAFQLLSAESPLYAALSAPVLAKLDAACKAYSGNLLQPHTLMHADDIRAMIAAIEPEKLFQEKENIEKFYIRLLQKGLYCAGVIDSQGNLSLFPEHTPAEFLVYADGGLLLLNSDLANGKVVEQEKKYLYPGQVIWAFADGVSCREFFRKETLNGTKLLKLPAQWPTNLHLSIY